jgi:broad specificity phosphatase PhoE
MPPQKLMLIRHGEKEPNTGPPPYGVNEQGVQDKHSLSPQGWQRAGALVRFFRNAWADGIETPDAVYASKVGSVSLMDNGDDLSKSLRPQQTVTPLVKAINPQKGLQTPNAVGEEQQLAQTISENEDGIVLVAWEHKHIPIIAQIFSPAAPDQWPDGTRFDLVWLLTRSGDGVYAFNQVAELVLGGDLPAPS